MKAYSSSKDIRPPAIRTLEDLFGLAATHELRSDPATETMVHKLLENTQSNIIKANKHRFTLFCFLNFREGHQKEAAAFIQNLPLDSALQQIENRNSHKDQDRSVSVMFSYQGYEYFCRRNLSVNAILDLEESDEELRAFTKGIHKRCPVAFGNEEDKRKLKRREANYQTPSQVLILIGSNDERLDSIRNKPKNERQKELERLLIDWINYPKKIDGQRHPMISNIFFEIGLKNPEATADNGSKEWFGYKDGLSNPHFFPDPELQNKFNFKPDPPSALNLLLHKDYDVFFGSFVVFLKIEQNVKLFNELIASKTDEQSQLEENAAQLVGRYRDGRPLHPDFKLPVESEEYTNDFDYQDDPRGEFCPFSAHVRKVNPRDKNTHRRIVRRGKIYGHKNRAKKGLLFLSYQSSLVNFEDIVNRGMYGFSFNYRKDKRDRLFDPKGHYGAFSKGRLLTFRGGQYFYAPSINFIRDVLVFLS